MSQQFSSYIANNGTAKISGDAGLQPINIYVTAVTNGNSAAKTLTFADDANLGVLELPPESTLNLSFPIRCASFTPNHADVSVAYYVSTT